MADLVPHISAVQREQVLLEALDAARAVTDASSRVRCLTRLTPLLPDGARTSAIREALSAAHAIKTEEARTFALGELAPLLSDKASENLRFRALLTANSIVENRRRASALLGLAPRLPEAQRSAVFGMALSAARSATREVQQRPPTRPASVRFFDVCDAIEGYAVAWAGLASCLPSVQRSRAFAEAIKAVAAIPHDYHRVRALFKLALQGPEERRAMTVMQAYDAASNLESANNRLHALRRIIPLLPTNKQAEAVARALKAAETEAIEDEGGRLYHLTLFAEQLSGEERARMFTHLINGVLSSDPSYGIDVHVLTRLLPHASDTHRIMLCERGVEATSRMFDAHGRLTTLTQLIPLLPGHILPSAISLLVSAANECASDVSGIGLMMVGRAVSLLPDENRPRIVQKVLTNARNITSPYHRALVFIELLPVVPSEQYVEVADLSLESTRAVPSNEARARTLMEVADRLPSEQATPVLTEAEELARAITADASRGRLLAELAPRLPGERRRRAQADAIAAARGMTDPSGRATLLARLAKLLPERRSELVTEAFETAKLVADIDARGATFEALVRSLSGTEQVEALECILDRCSRLPRRQTLDKLSALAPVLAEVGGDELILSTVDAIRDTADWWR